MKNGILIHVIFNPVIKIFWVDYLAQQFLMHSPFLALNSTHILLVMWY
jgi:hypothetical protein